VMDGNGKLKLANIWKHFLVSFSFVLHETRR